MADVGPEAAECEVEGGEARVGRGCGARAGAQGRRHGHGSERLAGWESRQGHVAAV